MSEKRKKPEVLGAVVASVLEQSGIAARVEQAAVIPEWAGLVGPQIAAVTEPHVITADGTLFVAVRTHAWMTELSLMEPELLRQVNSKAGRAPILRIRWQLMR